MKAHGILAYGFVLVAAYGGMAGASMQPDLGYSSATANGGTLFICPAGDGRTLEEADTVILVTLRDWNDVPIEGFPREQIRVHSAEPGALVFCQDGNIADFDTNSDGQTTFSGSFAGGGYSQDGLVVTVMGAPLLQPPLDIQVNSPDINGDLKIDLGDFSGFAADYWAYDFRSDFFHDGTINLSDYFIFYTHFCHHGPDAETTVQPGLSGEIGIFFDTAGTVTGLPEVPLHSVLTAYLVAFDAAGGIQGYELSIAMQSDLLFISRAYHPSNSLEIGQGPDWIVTTGSECLPGSGSVLLAEFDVFLLTDEAREICLGPATASCLPDAQGPAYLPCDGSGAYRYFGRAYEGCAVVNGEGPVAAAGSTWGSLKALYRN